MVFCNWRIILFLILFSSFFIIPAGAMTHPSLLFNDIKETPGYTYNTVQPWKSYQQQIITSANIAMKRDFSKDFTTYNRVFYRADWARDTGLAYQITKKPEYAQKAREALLHMDVGTVTMKTDSALAFGSYALAYDFIQPTLDAESDGAIRDKLATLTDKVYKDLNDNGKSKNYVSFSDYHSKAYPMVGIAGAALLDFTNPHHLPLSSGPSDWSAAGADYLFVSDKLHTGQKSIFSYGFDEESGKHISGAYKAYVIDEVAWWLQVYNHVYRVNPFDKYPAAKRAFTSELWESMPNGYGNNFETNGNVKWTYHRYFLNLLPDNERGMVLNYLDQIEKSNLLPYSSVAGGKTQIGLLYCVYGKYENIQKGFPAETSHLDPAGLYQVFRKDWQPDADWLSLVTWNFVTPSNRVMIHPDQAGIEYYSHGDLLLADAGEDKYVFDRLYGEYEIHHNTMVVSDPRSPFPSSSWGRSEARGIFKGDAKTLITPLPVTSALTSAWIEFINTGTTIHQVNGDSFGTARDLSSPVSYTRSVLYPERDFFILIDRMQSDETWKYSMILRPSSLAIKPTVPPKSREFNETGVGSVKGTMVLNGRPYDWLGLPFKKETYTGLIDTMVTWKTQNPSGKDVELRVFSIPPSKIYVSKLVGRIAGYDARSEVFSPVIRMESAENRDVHRITLLLSRYTDEAPQTVTVVPVAGEGDAVRVKTAGKTDIVYAGSGISTFDRFRTDASIVHIRMYDNITEITLLDGSYLDYGNDQWVHLTKTADYITVKKSGGTLEYYIGNKQDITGSLFSSATLPPGRHGTLGTTP